MATDALQKRTRNWNFVSKDLRAFRYLAAAIEMLRHLVKIVEALSDHSKNITGEK